MRNLGVSGTVYNIKIDDKRCNILFTLDSDTVTIVNYIYEDPLSNTHLKDKVKFQ